VPVVILIVLASRACSIPEPIRPPKRAVPHRPLEDPISCGMNDCWAPARVRNSDEDRGTY